MTLIEAIKDHMDGKRIKVMFGENIENIPLGDLEILAEMGAEFREFETAVVKPKEPKEVKVKPTDSQLLMWSGEGMTAKEISDKCGFAESTVYNWLAKIKKDAEAELEDVANDILDA